jgi:hypothetical protein
MRKMKIESWEAKLPDGKEVSENLIVAMGALINGKRPEDMPRGLEKFKIFSKLMEAFDKAEKTKILELEDREYEFLKSTLEKDVPAVWGLSKNLTNAINTFIELKEE